ncbi:MAG: hypothetical protein V7K18_06735 [Nostoc sp.]|uniref:hypothetical protein n=1 Tax=Nostoc sp. TaxID=1180 RepID=UPI002FF4589C
MTLSALWILNRISTLSQEKCDVYDGLFGVALFADGGSIIKKLSACLCSCDLEVQINADERS